MNLLFCNEFSNFPFDVVTEFCESQHHTKQGKLEGGYIRGRLIIRCIFWLTDRYAGGGGGGAYKRQLTSCSRNAISLLVLQSAKTQ